MEGLFDCINEITSLLAFTSMTDSSSAYRVETTSRLAQWRIDNSASCTYRKSDPFKIGKWNWLVFFTCVFADKLLYFGVCFVHINVLEYTTIRSWQVLRSILLSPTLLA